MERCAHEDEMREILRGCEGLLVELLTDREREAFDYLCEKNAASRVYEGASGFLGLARVRIADASLKTESSHA